MTVWILWVVLVTGERIEGGQYQSSDACWASAQMQRTFWIGHHPRPQRMVCEPKHVWEPATRG